VADILRERLPRHQRDGRLAQQQLACGGGSEGFGSLPRDELGALHI